MNEWDKLKAESGEDLLKCRKGEQIMEHEKRLNYWIELCKMTDFPRIPKVVTVWAINDYAKGIIWWSEYEERKLYLLGGPNFTAAEYISHLEWDIVFIGTLRYWRQSDLFFPEEVIRSIKGDNEEIIAILVVNHELKDGKGRNLINYLFPVPLIIPIGSDKRLCLPKMYLKSQWFRERIIMEQMRKVESVSKKQ